MKIKTETTGTYLFEKEVDIYAMPEVVTESLLQDPHEITLGDLHGNPIKMLFLLALHGIAAIDPKDYSRLVEIYKKDNNNLAKMDFKEFNDVLNKIKFKRKDVLIRLIGDVLADRGKNDYFTLLLLAVLHKNDIPMEVLFSNHDAEFMENSELIQSGKSDYFKPLVITYYNQAQSMVNLQKIIDKKLVLIEDQQKEDDQKAALDRILELANTVYKPKLKILSYTHCDNKITIYSHACIGLNTIKSMAHKFSVNYQDDTADNLAKTIDDINNKFQEHINNGTVHTLYDLKNYGGEKVDCPFVMTLWNRLYDHLDDRKNRTQPNYDIAFVHGHDKGSSMNRVVTNVSSLDNDLGKDLGEGWENSKGTYQALVSLRSSLPNEIVRTVSMSEDNNSRDGFVIKDQSFLDMDDNLWEDMVDMVSEGGFEEYFEREPESDDNVTKPLQEKERMLQSFGKSILFLKPVPESKFPVHDKFIAVIGTKYGNHP